MIGEHERTRLMRQLFRAGVTHFVVSDELYGKLVEQQIRQNGIIGSDLNPLLDTNYMTFRGNRILRQSDLENLPFAATRQIPHFLPPITAINQMPRS
jgi:hypothetical protein